MGRGGKSGRGGVGCCEEEGRESGRVDWRRCGSESREAGGGRACPTGDGVRCVAEAESPRIPGLPDVPLGAGSGNPCSVSAKEPPVRSRSRGHTDEPALCSPRPFAPTEVITSPLAIFSLHSVDQ